MKFLMKDAFDSTPTFDYYKYIGSLTTPPCEEYTIWVVTAKPLLLGPSIISMISSTNEVPNSHDCENQDKKIDNLEGSFRYI